ncbi:MAG TPA: hypothetical protein DHW78_05240 [Ruminococcaceae bacterium]|nr:hypothetical protein [Oscillospiraceae bacterium]HCM23711.1 hypothetical protein [Oscillospiraceae bacterium]
MGSEYMIAKSLMLGAIKMSATRFISMHIGKAHIHNHIIFNSTALDCTRKFRDFLDTCKVSTKH